MVGPGVWSEGPRRRFGHGGDQDFRGFTTVTALVDNFYTQTYTKRALDAMVYVACAEGGTDDNHSGLGKSLDRAKVLRKSLDRTSPQVVFPNRRRFGQDC